MNAVATERIQEVGALENLVPEWWDLWHRCKAATPFQSPVWLVPWWRTFTPGTLFAITIRQAKRLVGLAPLFLEETSIVRRILPLGIGISDYLDVLLDREVDAARAALVRHVTDDPAWEEWELTELAPEASALQLQSQENLTELSECSSACPVLVLPDNIARLRQAVPANQWQNLLTARNRASRRGQWTVVSADRSSVLELLNALARLHCACWQSRGEHGVLTDPRVLEFHAQAVVGLNEARMLRLYALLIANQIAAVHYGFLHRERAYVYLTGFDPAYAFESPGTILMGHAIEEAVQEGAREFHFLRGREPYKYRWGATDRWNRRRVFRRLHACARAS